MKKPFNGANKMPFGPHRGKKLCEVPAYYLLSLLEHGILYGDLLEYVEDRKEDLELKEKIENSFKNSNV